LAIGTASIAGLSDCNAIVSVGPPLFWSEASSGRTLSPIVSPLRPMLLPKPHELSSEMLKVPFPIVPALSTPQLVPLLLARIEFTTSTAVASAKIAAPAPLALLFENVLLVTVPP